MVLIIADVRGVNSSAMYSEVARRLSVVGNVVDDQPAGASAFDLLRQA